MVIILTIIMFVCNNYYVCRLFIVCHGSPPPIYAMKDVFGRFGDLIDIYMLNGKNFGYAKYASKESADKAIMVFLWLRKSADKAIMVFLWLRKSADKAIMVFLWLRKSADKAGYHGIYASPTSGEVYRNRRLTTNFEL